MVDEQLNGDEYGVTACCHWRRWRRDEQVYIERITIVVAGDEGGGTNEYD